MSEKRACPVPVLQALSQAFAAFDELERIMGPELARTCWDKIPKQSPLKRGPKGPRSAKKDALLLRIYDKAHKGRHFLIDDAEAHIAKSVLRSNQILMSCGLKFGASEETITRRLKELVRDRNAQSIAKNVSELAVFLKKEKQSSG